jgi:hypothetical protein
MLYDPGVWLFGLALALFLAGILGVVLSTRRVPPDETPGLPGSIIDPGSERRLLELEAEIDRLRAERDELRGILGRLAALLERPRRPVPADRKPQLVSTSEEGDR